MSDLQNKCVITCALTGVLTNPKQYPVPVTPEEMASILRKKLTDSGIEWNVVISSKIVPKITEKAGLLPRPGQ